MPVRARRLIRAALSVLTVAAAAASSTIVTGAVPAAAGPAPGLCAGDDSRGSVPGDFALDACVNSGGFWVRNNLSIPVHLSVSGDTGTPGPVSVNQAVEAVVTRLRYSDPLELMPSDLIHIPAGAGAASVSIADTDAGGFYALALTAATFIPAGAAVQVYQAFVGFLTEIADVYGQYRDCLVGKNWIGKIGCDALLSRNVAFAAGRAVANGLAKGLLSLFLSTASFLKWADAQVPDVSAVIHGSRTISLAAVPASTAPPATAPPATAPLATAPSATQPAATQPPATAPPASAAPLTFSFSQNPFVCDGTSHGLGRLGGAQPGERVTFTSATVGGLLPGTADGNGQIGLIWQCSPNEAGQSWVVTAAGQISGRSGTFTVTGVAPTPAATAPPATQPPAAQTWDELAWGPPGSSNPLFSGGPGVNSNGSSGPAARNPVGSHITVDCRAYNQAVAASNSGGWWYHISAGPWAGYWAPASVYENGSGPYPNTGGLVDEAVRVC